MATLTAEHGSLFTTLFGGKKPDRTRFYACELKWNTWECRRTQQKLWTPKADTIATQLVPIDESIPEFFDVAVISYKLRKPVLVKNTDFPQK